MTDSSPKDEKCVSCESGDTFSPLSGDSSQNNMLEIFSPAQFLPRRPKRPLSAYNIFFRESRRTILQKIPDARKKGKRHGKIGFEDLARTIGTMWKNINSEDRAVYDRLATEDRKRYDHEMFKWRSFMQGNTRELQAKDQIESASASAIGHENFSTTQLKVRSVPSYRASCTSAPSPLGIPHLPQTAHHAMHASNFQSIRIEEAYIWHKFDNTIVPASNEVIMTSHCIKTSVSRTGCVDNTFSTQTLNLVNSSNEDSRNPSTNKGSTSSNMTNSVPMHNTSPSILDGVPLLDSFEKYTGGTSEEKSDSFCPTNSPDYVQDYSWLANKIGMASTTFLINMFQG